MTDRLTDTEIAEIEKRWAFPTTTLFNETREEILTLLSEIRRLRAIEAAAREVLYDQDRAFGVTVADTPAVKRLRAALDGSGASATEPKESADDR